MTSVTLATGLVITNVFGGDGFLSGANSRPE